MNPDWNKSLPKHLPAPSYAPPVLALGVMLMFWGLLTTWIISGIGALAIGFGSVLWITGWGASRRLSTPQTRMAAPPVRIAKTPSVATASAWLHSYAVVLSVWSLAAIIAGALVTSQGTVASPFVQQLHRVLGISAGLLSLGFALWIRRAGWILFGLVVLDALLGSRSPGVSALHAFLAQLIFAATVGMAVTTSPSWKCEPEWTDDMSRCSLRLLAAITGALVVGQVALGAAVRHKVMGAGLHITFALVVALMIVCVGALVCNHCPQHRTLRPCAIMMMIIAGAQVFLGFAAFTARMMAEDNTLTVVITTTAHVTTGALTLASLVVLTLQLRRHLRPAVAQKGAVVS